MNACLIVDDSHVVRKIMRRIVERLGFDCSEAENGLDAYNLCLQTLPAIIIIDHHMPVMSGLELLRKLHALPGAQPKVIFCSADNSPAQIRSVLQEGADDYIMKPFNADIVQSKFRWLGFSSGQSRPDS